MVNRFSELRNKEIIHVCEGTRLGYLNDVCIDTDTGRVTAIMVPGPCRFLGCSAETPTTSFPGAASAESGRISSSSKEPFRAGACCARNEGCSEASRARKKPENRKKF